MSIFLYKKDRKGFTLIEVMVSLVVSMMLVFGIYSLVMYSLHITADNKFYVEALEIANQKMEQIRNLSYNDVGTISGSPAGVIPDYEYSVRGRYTIYTSIQFYDDPYDGTLEDIIDTDDIFIDYKIVTIKVFWNGKFGDKNITVFSKIIPVTEETLEGYGLLKIIVVDADSNPLPNANVHVENNVLNPIMSADYVTGLNGVLSLAVLPEFKSYEITVTKTGMGIDKTYDKDLVNIFPSKPHLSITEGLKEEQVFSIDFLSNLTVRVIDQQLPDNWQVNTDLGLEIQQNPNLTIDNNGFIYLVWEDFRSASASKIYAQKYDYSGEQQWTPDDIVITTANGQINPYILSDINNNSYIAWNDDSVGNQDIYLIQIDPNGGDGWGGEEKVDLLFEEANQANPKLALFSTGTSTAIVFEDDRNTDIDLYMQSYDEDGNQLWSPEVRVNRNTISDSTDQYSPSIAIDSTDNIYIAWTDNRNGDSDIYAQKYNSSGVYSWNPDLRINIDMGDFDQYDVYITINPVTDEVLACWTDERNGNVDIYVSGFDYYEAPSYISEVPLTLVGTKQIGDAPVIFEHDEDYITDVNGYLNIDLEWDTGYSFGLPDGYEDYEIIFTNLVQPFEVLPNSNEEILLYLKP